MEHVARELHTYCNPAGFLSSFEKINDFSPGNYLRQSKTAKLDVGKLSMLVLDKGNVVLLVGGSALLCNHSHLFPLCFGLLEVRIES